MLISTAEAVCAEAYIVLLLFFGKVCTVLKNVSNKIYKYYCHHQLDLFSFGPVFEKVRGF
jgi:hypothetical protein